MNLPIHLARRIKKNLFAFLARTDWDRKAIWLEADHARVVSRDGDSLHFRNVGLVIPRGQFAFLLDGYHHLDALHRYGGFDFEFDGTVLTASDGSVSVEIRSAEELFILNEIFLQRDYGFARPTDSVVVDIGMNVGFASLYFASRPEVQHVYGFEPFTPTYEQCQRNLARNPDLSPKITPHGFGLASKAGQRTVGYDFDRKGQMSVEAETAAGSSADDLPQQTVQLKPVVEEIEKVSMRHPRTGIVLKVDCEGGEYEIFRSFEEHGIPSPVKAILMEWHKGGSGAIRQVLAEEEFHFVETRLESQQIGMIYAFRA